MHESLKHKPTFGYLSAVHSPEHGYFGGYLIVSPLGRPLEFHCTAPVMPSRAQRILYGSALEPYLLGEQIGRSLIAAAKLAPALLLTDFPQFEAITDRIGAPLLLVTGKMLPDGAMEGQTGLQCDASSPVAKERVATHPGWRDPFVVATHTLQLPIGMESKCDVVAELLAVLTERVELAEPFERIHEAIREAQRIGMRGAESHGQAA
jgi:hypothetical protein